MAGGGLTFAMVAVGIHKAVCLVACMAAAAAFRRVQLPTPWAYGMSNGDGEMSERLLTVGEAAEMLRTSERFPRRLIAERRIRFTRVGRHVRIPESALREFIAAGLVEPVTTTTKKDAVLCRNDDSAGSGSSHQAATRHAMQARTA
jgi:excisionase family DNA binding protein